MNVHKWRLGNMEKYILRVTFGEARYFARVLSKDQFSFAIETLYPVQEIVYSEASQGDYNNVSFFEESVLKAFPSTLIFQILFVLNRQMIKQKLRELEFSLLFFIDNQNSAEKNIKIQHILGSQFYKSNFPNFELPRTWLITFCNT